MLESLVFSQQQQAQWRMGGELEDDVDDREKRRVWLGTAPMFEDLHIRKHTNSPAVDAPATRDYLIPQGGAQLCRLPRSRLLQT